ncbi:peptidyl-tRNA hydrolase ICT1, mitochondrial isoform X2 [Nematostella vectensis]|uniref:peptidyl-tRNA hydrolase ICT1, mitochondrial isoform X2 n=1 Tax=Nematostella vectensis TaxID=45351 RepID=UPI0020772B51|nr:peptidyl-tRNA hydrolase ICT1, mitochondrial isoform X2 [Nematostella vectensis]
MLPVSYCFSYLFRSALRQHLLLVAPRYLHLTGVSRKDEEKEQGGYYEFTGPVPQDQLLVKFAKSTGPGGQNVNKVNTKVDVRFHVPSANWIPEEVRLKLLEREKNRINKDNELVISSTKHRSQHRNLQDAICKIEEMVKEASYIPREPSEEQRKHG